MRPVLWAALWLIGSAHGAVQGAEQGSIADGPVKPAAKAAQATDLQYFVGSWLVTARDPATAQAVTLSYLVEPDPGGRWLSGRAESADRGIAARDKWGIDPATGEIVRFVFDGSGAYGIVRAPEWTGDSLILTGEAKSRTGPTKVRETITRHGQDRFDAVWEAMVDGAWKAYSIEQATRR